LAQAKSYDPEDAGAYSQWADDVMEMDWTKLTEDEQKAFLDLISRRDGQGLWFRAHGVE
jgi:hypothetical protein